MLTKFLYIILIFLTTTQLHACNSGNELEPIGSAENSNNSKIPDSMKIKITINDTVITATLNSSQAAKDFVSLLPIKLTLDDYAQTEKVSKLSKRLSTTDSPSGYDPDVGDITYYAPWGNLAIFYNDFGYAEGLIKLGKINGDISLFKSGPKLDAFFEIAQ